MRREANQVEHADHPEDLVATAEAASVEATTVFGEGAIPDVAPVQPAGAAATASEKAFGGGPPVAYSDANALTAPMVRAVEGVSVIAPPGTHAAAIDKAEAFVRQLLGRNEVAQQKLAAARTIIVIIPAGKPMTDLPEFASLAGKKTFDGRDWSTVRGSGGTTTSDGSIAIAVAEENLIDVQGVSSGYPRGYSIGMHELAHMLEGRGMTKAQKRRLDTLYANRRRPDPEATGDRFTDGYAASNKREYFAQCTNAFFGQNEGRDAAQKPNHNGREWLRINDPDMYLFLVEMYETDHEVEPDDS